MNANGNRVRENIPTTSHYRWLPPTSILTVLFLVARTWADSITVNLPLQEIIVGKGDGQTAQFVGASPRGDPGQPALPYLIAHILLPPNVDIASIKTELTATSVVSVAGEWDVLPMAPPVLRERRADKVGGLKTRTERDAVAYATDRFVPETFLISCSVSQMREYRLAEVVIAPFQYNAARRTLMRLEQSAVKITFNRLQGLRVPRNVGNTARSLVRKQLRDTVLNYDAEIREYNAAK